MGRIEKNAVPRLSQEWYTLTESLSYQQAVDDEADGVARQRQHGERSVHDWNPGAMRLFHLLVWDKHD